MLLHQFLRANSAVAKFSTTACAQGLVGHGIDMVSIERIQRVHSRFALRFTSKVLAPEERQEFGEIALRNPQQSIVYLAGRWAAKEAAYKALSQDQVLFSDIYVKRSASGQPLLDFRGSAAAAAEKLGVNRALISLTHEGDLAMASVLLSD